MMYFFQAEVLLSEKNEEFNLFQHALANLG